MLEKRFYAVPPQLFTADGTTSGVITIAGHACSLFKVKQHVILKATGLPNLTLEVKEIDNEDNVQVGPFPSPGKPASIDSRTDISAYTVALGATISANEQKRPAIDWAEAMRAMYEEEPTVAMRSILVDECGDKYNDDNPLPVAFDGTINIADVRVSACDNDPNPGDIHSSIRISDCTNDLKINADGSINVNVEVPPLADLENITLRYDETAAVASGVSTAIITYVTPVGPPVAISRVLVSGENIARYDIAVNGAPIATQRTCFGSDLSRTIEFNGSDGSGYDLAVGDVVTVTVLHNRPYTAIFEATLELVANPILVPGEHPSYTYNEITGAVSGTTYTIATYTVLPGRTATLQRVLTSGENIARYDVFINAGPVATQRTCFGGDLDALFEFMGWNGGGLPLSAGDTVTVKVVHNRPASVSFEATIEAIEYT